MQYGAVFPQTESGHDPIAIRDYAQAVEDMGYSFLLAYDHILGANPDRPGGWNGPYTYQDTFHEPFTLFSYLAGLTRKLEFATGILILPQRQTVLVAKQAAQVDVLSGGRLRLGVGIGWNKVEYDALGENFHNRGKRSEEQVKLLRELWTKPLVTFSGEFHHIDDAGINPLPGRIIPIWFGGMADAVLERMARLGDGWMPNPVPPERARAMAAALREHLERFGRNPADFGIDVRINLSRQPESEWAQYIQMWRDLGATHVGVNTMGASFTSLQEHLDALRYFQRVIMS